MSVQTPSQSVPSGYGGAVDHDPNGTAWMMFAGTMLLIVGILNIIGGIAAIDNANFYINNAQYVVSDLNTWGWVILVTGVVQLLAGFGVWARNQLARWLGVGFASLNSIAQLLMLPSYPLFALALFAIDVLVIYGLFAHGAREGAKA